MEPTEELPTTRVERGVDPTIIRAIRALLDWLARLIAAAIVVHIDARLAASDRDWGKVSQDTLPSWINVEAYLAACRAGRIEGARKCGRKWVAPREAVDRWWMAESDGVATPPEDDVEMQQIYQNNGLKHKK